jgi:serine protease AprX
VRGVRGETGPVGSIDGEPMSSSRTAPRPRAAAAAIAASGILAALTLSAANPASGSPSLQHVIVSGTDGSLSAVEGAVTHAGGHIRRVLGVIDGVAADLPADAVGSVSAAPGVRAVTPDAQGHLMGIDPTLGYDVAGDAGSLYNIAQVTHAKDMWSHKYTGQGIDVALIDSGVSDLAGLNSGNVVNGPDLSFESQDPDLIHRDTYGHGTHMASIIAGRDVQLTGDKYAKPDSHDFLGIAPDARIVSLKVANADGSADVSQIIAAIDWVTQNAQQNGLNIRVLNLSYGTNSAQDVAIDPLDYAVEQAWRAGITVVVSAGNDGTTRAPLADPANDPLVLAVGADDTRGTDSVGDDIVPDFSQHGTAARHVDVIAPGVHVLGLRDPGSSIDQANPQAVVNSRFFRGSGTSQAAAVVSGLSALYLSKYPTATPDDVKYALMSTATTPNSVKTVFAGVGVPDVNKASGVKPTGRLAPVTGATGAGSLEAARGSSHVNDGFGDLIGEIDIFGQPWTSDPAGHQWTNGFWNGHQWTGSQWTGNTWTGAQWTGNTWTGQSWTGHQWTGHQWTGNTWTGAQWTDSAWLSSNWDSASWSGVTWSAANWG